MFIQQLARRFVRRGHEVEVWTTDAGEIEYLWNPSKERVAPGAAQDGDIGLYRYPLRHLPFPSLTYQGLRRVVLELDHVRLIPTGLLWALTHYTPWLPTMGEAFRSETLAVDLVHLWNIPFESLLAPAWRYARRQEIPVAITPLLHLGEANSDHVRRRYTMRHQLALIRDCDAVMALTDIEAAYLVQEGVNKSRIHVIGGGTDPTTIAAGKAARFRARYGLERPFILFVGALNPEKGTLTLVQAMSTLWEKGRAVDLVMIGQPMQAFQTFLSQKRPEIRRRCHVLGAVNEADKADALNACHVLALPSRTESFGLVFLEAWAAAKPVVGARAGAIPALVEADKDGLLVPFGDPEALAEAVTTLLDNPDLCKRLGRAGQQKVKERYTWNKVTEQVTEMYKDMGADHAVE